MKNESINKKAILGLKEELLGKIEESVNDQQRANREDLKEFYKSIEDFYRYALTEVEELLK